MRVAIVQPQYFPHLAMIDKIDLADKVVLFDNTQFKKRYFEHRNRLKLKDGVVWITAPVHAHQKDEIKDVRLVESEQWMRKHQETIRHCYAKAPYLEECWPMLEVVWTKPDWRLASMAFISMWVLSRLYGTHAKFEWASDLAPIPSKPIGRFLADLTVAAGGDTYLSGASGREYFTVEDLACFAEAGVTVEFQDFRHPVYQQGPGEFIPNLSSLDLLMWHGPNAMQILRQANGR